MNWIGAMEKKGIIIVAYGLGSLSAGQVFAAFCKEAELCFKPLPVRYAFTSEHGRKALAKRKIKSDSVLKAIEKMVFEKFTHIYIQSLHLIPGVEYKNLLQEAGKCAQEHGIRIDVASPLFNEDYFFVNAVSTLVEKSSCIQADNEAILYMGHGTNKEDEPEADAIYISLAKALEKKHSSVFLACMNGSLELEDVIKKLKARNINKIYLLPFLTLIGRHATEDMGGDNDDSWKSQLESEGFECEVILHSLLQYDDFTEYWLKSLRDLIENN